MSVQNEKVSVIIPIFNVAGFLDQALLSVREQTHRNLEIICVNDGSTDNSLEIIKKHASEDPRIVIIDKENQGYGATCNRGIRESTGEWIAILEPDDWIEPGMYEEMLAHNAKFGGTAQVIKTPYWRINKFGGEIEQQVPCHYKDQPHPKKQPFPLKKLPNLIAMHPSIWSAIYRKSFLEEKGIRFPEFPGAGWADNPFLVDSLCQAERIVYLDKAFYCYREETPEHTKNFTKKCFPMMFERWNQMTDIIERLGITDAGILRAHYRHGFTYAETVFEHVGLEDPEVFELTKKMFSRMDANIVKCDLSLAERRKEIFASVLGIEDFSMSKAERLSAYARRTMEMVGTVGIYETLRSIRSYG